jgi:hypothetical protein
MRGLLVCIAVGLVASSARADCIAQSAQVRPHLIELFSSEGCSSCPPAEGWLRTLHNGADVVSLEFHVDYWDSLGWRDRFADARYTARQQALAARAGNGIVYTPEVALDGREWRDWYRSGAPGSSVHGAVSMKLAIRQGTPLHVHIDTTPADAADAASYRNYIAVTEDGLSSQVRAGENRGTTLKHDHVVRAFIGPLPPSTDTPIALPADLDMPRATLVAFAQRERDGAVGQVVTLPLGQCHQ